MDRQAFTTGQLVPNAQLLGMEKSKLVALGYALEAVMGAGGTVVSGLACTPTASPSLSVVVGRGSIMTTAAIDGVAYSDLGADTNATIKQGVLQEPGVILALTPPSTAGYSQVYLIQAKQGDVDTSTLVPFYNASNPAQPYNGPNNSGNSTLTLRQSQCIVSLKAGAAAATGSQTTPSPDLGNVALYTITLVNGQTQITAGQILKAPGAPFIPVTLPAVPAGVQSGAWTYAVDTGAAGALAATLNPAPTSLPDGMRVNVQAGHAAAGSDSFNPNGLGALPIKRRGGGIPQASDWATGDILTLIKLGSTWQLADLVASDMASPSVFNQISLALENNIRTTIFQQSSTTSMGNGYATTLTFTDPSVAGVIANDGVGNFTCYSPGVYNIGIYVTITTSVNQASANDSFVQIMINGQKLGFNKSPYYAVGAENYIGYVGASLYYGSFRLNSGDKISFAAGATVPTGFVSAVAQNHVASFTRLF